MNIFAMVREGLRRDLTTALNRAVRHCEPVRRAGLRVKTNGDYSRIDLTVRPEQTHLDGILLTDFYLIVLETATPELAAPGTPAAGTTASGTAGDAPTTGDGDREQNARIAELELRAKEAYLQSTREEKETSNEELKSTNEEMQSVDEEIQSTNEELETSKEELQSVNEELATVNAELQTKVADLSRANNDMNNLLAGTGSGDPVRRPPTAHHAFQADRDPADQADPDRHRSTGRRHRLQPGRLHRSHGRRAGRSERPNAHEHEVQSRQGAWYLMRTGPYRTLGVPAV